MESYYKEIEGLDNDSKWHYAWSKDRAKKLGFGVFKDKAWSKVNHKYLEWLIGDIKYGEDGSLIKAAMEIRIREYNKMVEDLKQDTGYYE